MIDENGRLTYIIKLLECTLLRFRYPEENHDESYYIKATVKE